MSDWLPSYQQYQNLLGAADLGLSFHLSSSGLDFPMKIVDMLASELPVIAYRFPSLSELIDEDSCQCATFQDCNELASLISVIRANILCCNF